MRPPTALLALLLALALAAPLAALAAPLAPNACPDAQAHRYVDISAAKIEKTRTFEYSLELFDSPVRVVMNSSHLSFEGNFSRFVLVNSALRREFVYWGRQLVVKLPAEHVFNMKKIPSLEIQIVHSCEEVTRDNPYHYLLLSQLYVVSKFTNKIETNLSRYFHQAMRDGDVVATARIVKMLEGFSLLMYRGTPEAYPCRQDLLCMLKREYQLISEEDYQQVKQFVESRQGEAQRFKMTYKRKSIYEIQPARKERAEL